MFLKARLAQELRCSGKISQAKILTLVGTHVYQNVLAVGSSSDCFMVMSYAALVETALPPMRRRAFGSEEGKKSYNTNISRLSSLIAA